MVKETAQAAHDYLFTREGMPPIGELIPCALQHVLASFAGIITPAILIATNCGPGWGWGPSEQAALIQVALILSAIDTGLQAFAPVRRLGAGLPIVMGTSFAFLPALQAMGMDFPFSALLGGQIVGAISAILFGLFYEKLKPLFPPVVTGTVVAAIGISLYPTAVKYMAGGVGTEIYGTPAAWVVALVTFAVVFGLNNFGKGILKTGSVFFGMIVGILFAIPFGMVDFSAASGAAPIALPSILPYGITFEPTVCITLAIVFPMVAVQILGDVSAACLGSLDRMPTEDELSGAVVAQGVTSIFSAFLGGLPTSALGQNVGIIVNNKVVNKWVFVAIAAIFAVVGLSPALAAVLGTIPNPVIGGATVGVFGIITMNGVRMFSKDGLNPRTNTIVGTSLVIGLGISMSAGCLAGPGMPSWVAILLGSNAITPAAITAILLNLILPNPAAAKPQAEGKSGK